jgi:DNA-binding NarL/FixJ family response regulator
VAERAGAQLEAGRSQTLAGRALAANGERTAAIATLRASHEKLLSCGAFRYSDYAAKQLRDLGRAVPRGARAQPGKPNILGLTVREHEVMEHVATGKPNREIAEALFLSPRTVDRHLARIFQKLNVHSRAAATSTFERANNR